jgi:hypothetical protein
MARILGVGFSRVSIIPDETSVGRMTLVGPPKHEKRRFAFCSGASGFRTAL